MLIKTVSGRYSPSFFSIHIESDCRLEECIQSNEQTFVHEYIHLLQDIIHPYCMKQTIAVLRRFAFVHLTVKESGKLTIPFTNWDDEDCETQEMTSHTWGGDRFISEASSITSMRREGFQIRSGQWVYKYIATTDSSGEYQIGARDLLEYLAHKIENYYWETNAPDLPYRAIDKVFDHLGLQEIPEEVRVCIVDYCLYNDNPFHHFMNIFIDKGLIYDHSDKFRSYEVCKKFLKNLGWQLHDGSRYSLHTKTEESLKKFEKYLIGIYSNKLFGDVIKWINLVVEYSKKNFSEGLIFSDLYGLDRAQFSHKINEVIDCIGIPHMSNQNYESGCRLPGELNGDDFLQLHTLGKFMDYIDSYGHACPIFRICEASDPGAQQEKCWTDPFALGRNIPDGGRYCAFGAFVKMNGFDKIDMQYLPYPPLL